jgi:hypothetical protein
VTGCCEHGDNFLDSVKGREFRDVLTDCQAFSKDSAPLNFVVTFNLHFWCLSVAGVTCDQSNHSSHVTCGVD